MRTEPFKVTKDGDYYFWDGMSYPNKETVFFTGLLPLCGCYDEENYNKVWNVFESICKSPEFIYYDKISEIVGIDKTHCELILMLLNNADLLEHGTACRGSWISEYGKEVYNFMTDDSI